MMLHLISQSTHSGIIQSSEQKLSLNNCIYGFCKAQTNKQTARKNSLNINKIKLWKCSSHFETNVWCRGRKS